MTASFDVEIYNNTGSMQRYHKWVAPANMIFTRGYEDKGLAWARCDLSLRK